MKNAIVAAALVVITAGIVPPAGAQQGGGNTAQLEEARKLIESGDLVAAISSLQRIVGASPASFEARLAIGRALDLDGRHGEARRHLEEALKLATDDQRTEALTTLGVSYAFESKADEAARYYQRAFDADVQANDRAAAAGRANALGRIYLESGNLQKAEQWYTTGYEMSRKIPELPAAQAALWEMRRHNALGRIEARRGKRAAADEHAAAVKALLDPIGQQNQRAFYPYLVGYIAFFSKQYRQAVDELLRGDQTDPFVLGLIAQAYDKLGDRGKAAEYFRKVLATPVHSINSAFSRPLARAFLR
jgi:tetratricopeptide (TPR) repeat protein